MIMNTGVVYLPQTGHQVREDKGNVGKTRWVQRGEVAIKEKSMLKVTTSDYQEEFFENGSGEIESQDTRGRGCKSFIREAVVCRSDQDVGRIHAGWSCTARIA